MVEINVANKTDQDNFIRLMQGLNIYNNNTRPKEERITNLDERLEKVKEKAINLLNDSFNNPDLNILIAYLNGQAVGYCLSFKFDDLGLIDHLYLDESARGHGIGEQLVNQVKVWMVEKEIKTIEIKVFPWNTKAINFYEKLDFKQNYISYKKGI